MRVLLYRGVFWYWMVLVLKRFLRREESVDCVSLIFYIGGIDCKLFVGVVFCVWCVWFMFSKYAIYGRER